MANTALIVRPLAATVIGGTSSPAETPRENVLNNRYGLVYKRDVAGGGVQLRVDLDLGAVKEFDTIAVLWHNGRASDSFTLIWSSDAAFTSDIGTAYPPARTSTTQLEDRHLWHMVHQLSAPVSRRYLRVGLNLSNAHEDGYAQMCRVVVGRSMDLNVGPQSIVIDAIDLGQIAESETGFETADEDALIVPYAKLGFDWATQEEHREGIRPLMRQAGQTKPVLIVPDVTEADLQDAVVFGRLIRTGGAESTRYDIWKAEFQARSIGP